MKSIEILVKLAAPRIAYGPRAEADLARILATPAPALPCPRRRWAALGVAVALVLVVLGSFYVLRPRPASATPPLLVVSPVEGTASSHLAELATIRRHAPEAPSEVALHAWTLVSDTDAAGRIIVSSTSPTITSTIFEADGSLSIATVAGSPFPGQDHRGLPAVGTPLSSQHLPAADSVAASLPSPLPSSAEALQSWLKEALDADPNNSEEAMLSLLGIVVNTPITPAQEAATLEYLATRPDVTLVGEVSDRLGRPGLSFQVGDGGDDYVLNVIVSPSSGQIIATETIYVGSSRTDITAPSVTSYEAWERK